MPVSEYHASKSRFVLLEVGEIGNDDVHPEHIRLGERQAAVHDEHIVGALKHVEVFPDFVEPAERNNPHRGSPLLRRAFFDRLLDCDSRVGGGFVLAAGSRFSGGRASRTCGTRNCSRCGGSLNSFGGILFLTGFPGLLLTDRVGFSLVR
jgi:hypothetical protein